MCATATKRDIQEEKINTLVACRLLVDVIVSLNLGSDSERLWSTPEISLVSQMPYIVHDTFST